MAQPPEVQAAADELIDLYRIAQESVQAQLAAMVAADPRGRAKRQRLRALERNINTALTGLERDSAAWIPTRLPAVYEIGARGAAAQLGQPFVWTGPHTDAIQALATETWDDILRSTSHVRGEVKKWLRYELRRQAGLSILEGRTPEQAVRALVGAAGEAASALGGDVMTVTYRNGARHQLSDWADSAIRSVVGRAQNYGALNTSAAAGVQFMEVLDGAGCGWLGHDTGDIANGTIRTIEECRAAPISHNRCQRSFAPRLDVTSRGQARSAPSLRSAEQMADQAQAERDRAATFERRRLSRQRQERQARRPREPRTSRTPRTTRSAG